MGSNERRKLFAEKIITYESLSGFAYSNDRLIKGEIDGIVLNFIGLGGQDSIERRLYGRTLRSHCDMYAEMKLKYRETILDSIVGDR